MELIAWNNRIEPNIAKAHLLSLLADQNRIIYQGGLDINFRR